jgi:hypothetical protein
METKPSRRDPGSVLAELSPMSDSESFLEIYPT